jgi:hypothetical protein
MTGRWAIRGRAVKVATQELSAPPTAQAIDVPQSAQSPDQPAKA